MLLRRNKGSGLGVLVLSLCLAFFAYLSPLYGGVGYTLSSPPSSSTTKKKTKMNIHTNIHSKDDDQEGNQHRYRAYDVLKLPFRHGENPHLIYGRSDDGDHLRRRGNEFGTSTGRPRRCGWFDAVAARYSRRIMEGDKAGRRRLYEKLGLPSDPSVE